MQVRIVPHESNTPPGKLANAELHFTDGPMLGLKLVGFAVWERKNGGGRNVTFPARSYVVGGEWRSFVLLRPSSEGPGPETVRELILRAFDDHEKAAGVA
jgi:hypothetical protein